MWTVERIEKEDLRGEGKGKRKKAGSRHQDAKKNPSDVRPGKKKKKKGGRLRERITGLDRERKRRGRASAESIARLTAGMTWIKRKRKAN